MFDKSFGIIPVCKSGNSHEFFLVHQITGHWAFPKGHKIGNETEQETALREFQEETGILQCQLVSDFRVIQHYYFEENNQKIDKEVIFFLGFVGKNNNKPFIQNDEVQNGQWFNYKDALLQLTYPESQQTLIEAQSYLNKKYKNSEN